MPGKVLSERFAGLFGKLPTSGDFVARGLSDAFRSRWDAWITRYLAMQPWAWPEGGLRFRLRSGSRFACGLVLPSQDAVGRRFPLSAMVVLPFAPEQSEVDRWCDDALPVIRAALSGDGNADTLWLALAGIALPEGPPAFEPGLLTVWGPSLSAHDVDPAEPEEALAALLSSGGCWTP